MYDRIRVCTDEGVWRDVKIGSDEHINSKGYDDWLLEQQQKKENQLKINNKMATSKITHVQGAGTWNDMFKFEVTMENGDTGTVFSKSQQPPFAVGDSKSYEITAMGRGHKIKWVQEQKAYTPSTTGSNYVASKDKEESIARAVALKAAVDLRNSDEPFKIIEVAQQFEHYLLTGNNLNGDALDNANSNAKMDAGDLPF